MLAIFAARKRVTAEDRSQFLNKCNWPLIYLHCGLMTEVEHTLGYH